MSDETEIRKIANELMDAAIGVGVNAFAGLIPKDEIEIRHEVNLDHFMDQIRDFLPSPQQPVGNHDTMPVALTELEWACNITDSNGGEDVLVSYVRPRLAALRDLFTEAPPPTATPDTLEKSGPCETCGESTTTCWHWGAWQHIDCHFGEPSPVKESLTTGPQADTPQQPAAIPDTLPEDYMRYLTAKELGIHPSRITAIDGKSITISSQPSPQWSAGNPDTGISEIEKAFCKGFEDGATYVSCRWTDQKQVNESDSWERYLLEIHTSPQTNEVQP